MGGGEMVGAGGWGSDLKLVERVDLHIVAVRTGKGLRLPHFARDGVAT